MRKEEVKCKITMQEGDVIISNNRGITLRYPQHTLTGALAVALTQTCMQVARRMLLEDCSDELEFTISYQSK